MAWQQEINIKMRRILVDWLVEVHQNFKLLPETLFITINLIDRFVQRKQIPRKSYQLIGVTCMLIASKYEEIYPPYVKDFIYISDNCYSKQELKDKEKEILMTLDFKVTWPSSLTFLDRYSHLA